MKRIVFYIFLVFTFTACEDVIEVELNEKDIDLYAVEAKITTVDEPFVFLTRGLVVSQDDSYQGISDAIVTISDNSMPANTLELVEDVNNRGLYIVPSYLSYKGVPGRAYTITIRTGNIELTASDTLKPVSTVDSINIWPSLRGNEQFLGIFMYGQEPEGLGDYYKWDIYINDTLLNDAGSLSLASDEFVDGNYVSALEIFTDYHDPNKPEERKINYEDEVCVKQISLSAFAYNYFLQLLNQSASGSMFSVPSANIKSNFVSSDGKEVLGLFTAHDVSVSNTININDSIEDRLDR